MVLLICGHAPSKMLELVRDYSPGTSTIMRVTDCIPIVGFFSVAVPHLRWGDLCCEGRANTISFPRFHWCSFSTM